MTAEQRALGPLLGRQAEAVGYDRGDDVVGRRSDGAADFVRSYLAGDYTANRSEQFEEEIGSHNLAAFLERFSDELEIQAYGRDGCVCLDVIDNGCGIDPAARGKLFQVFFSTKPGGSGLGLPTVGVYVILATLIAPALVKVGIAPMAAHMFLLYFGIMSMVTPPVALAAFAAANIAGADVDRTGWTATRIGWAAYLVPFLFVLSPPLLMNGAFLQVAGATSLAALGIWLGTVGVVGYFKQPVAPAKRGLLIGAGLSLMTCATFL